jgi:hypothetical protein
MMQDEIACRPFCLQRMDIDVRQRQDIPIPIAEIERMRIYRRGVDQRLQCGSIDACSKIEVAQVNLVVLGMAEVCDPAAVTVAVVVVVDAW